MLSWQSSKHSRDVFRGSVFPVFTEGPGLTLQRRTGCWTPTMAAVKTWAPPQTKNTQGQRKKTNLGNKNAAAATTEPFHSVLPERILMVGLSSACALAARSPGLNI